MKRLKVYFFTIFIMMASPALALTSNYDELRNDVTSCVASKKEESTAPEDYITNRTRELKSNKLTRPINDSASFDLNINPRHKIFVDCSIDAQPDDEINNEIIKVSVRAARNYTTGPEEKERCINEILRKTAINDWYVSECLDRKIKKDYGIKTVDDYYTKIYQINNEPESEPVSVSGSNNTEPQQADNGRQTIPTANTNNNSAPSKISVTVSDYYNDTGITGITVCYDNDGPCKQSDKNGKVTFTATNNTTPTVSINESSEYYCDEPKDITQLRADEQEISRIEMMERHPTGIKNSQHQFVIKCRKLCTDEDLQKLNKGLKEQNKIKKCFKNKREYEITECKYPESKLNNNQCKLYSNDITITGEGIDIKDVKIFLGKNKSKFKPAAEKDARGQTITIKDIDLNETKYISAKHGNQMITCEFKFRNNTICDFGSLNNNTIKEDVSQGTLNTSAENNNNQHKIPDEELTKENGSSGTPSSSELDSKLINAENNIVQQETPNEKQANKEQITEKQYNEIKSEIDQIIKNIEKEIESQCLSKKTDKKCKNKNKDKTIEQIRKAADETLSELNMLGNN